MAGKLHEYRPELVDVIWGDIIFDGFTDGVFVSVDSDNDDFDLQIGIDSNATRTKINNFSGTIQVTLAQSSDTNDSLSVARNADLLAPGGAGVKPFAVKDSSGSTLIGARHAWIQKAPTTSYSRGVESRVWTFRTNLLNRYDGGNTEVA